MAYDSTLRQELLGLDVLGSNRFLEMGRRLRAFYLALPYGEHKSKALNELLKDTKVSRRSAMYWIDIDRIYSRYKIPDARLARIGWSKLSIMARHVNAQTIEDWLSFAECNTTNAIHARIRKAEPARHHVVFKLSAAEKALLTAALVANGAQVTGSRNLFNKEAALLELCRRFKPGGAGHTKGGREGPKARAAAPYCLSR